MKPNIIIENRQDRVSPFRGYKSALRRAIAAALAEEGFLRKCEISVSLVSPEEICRLNGEYRGIHRETDVLSFPLWDEEDTEEVAYLGDIIICPHVIREQAKGYGTTYRQEMCLMAIHSTLHLLGWDHIQEDEKQKMFALQEKILDSLEMVKIKTETQFKE